MFMDICNPSENSCFSKIFPVLLKCDFSWFQPIMGRFYKMRVSWEFNIYNCSPFNVRCYRFLTRCEYYLWLDSKYNAWDVVTFGFRIKQFWSKSFSAPVEYFFKNGNPWAIGKTFHVIRGRVVYIVIVFIVSIWSDLLVFLLMIYVKY